MSVRTIFLGPGPSGDTLYMEQNGPLAREQIRAGWRYLDETPADLIRELLMFSSAYSSALEADGMYDLSEWAERARRAIGETEADAA